MFYDEWINEAIGIGLSQSRKAEINEWKFREDMKNEENSFCWICAKRKSNRIFHKPFLFLNRYAKVFFAD
jgi:hypothetical protein